MASTNTKTRSQETAAEINALLRARTPLIWIVSSEEARVESWLMKAAVDAGYIPRTWDCGQGVASIAGVVERIGSVDIGDMLTAIKSRASGSERGVWIMRDLPAWLIPPLGLVTCRQLRNLARFLPGTARAVATKIVKAGEERAIEIDRIAIAKIAEQRMAFLDLDPAIESSESEVQEPGRPLDMASDDESVSVREPTRALEL